MLVLLDGPNISLTRNLLSFGRSTPFTARVLPKDTNRSFVDAGVKPEGVTAVATPASATARIEVVNMFAIKSQDSKATKMKLKSIVDKKVRKEMKINNEILRKKD